MKEHERRKFLRTRFDARVQVVHPEHGGGIFRVGDVSDGGLYLHSGPFELVPGDVITVQVQGMPVEAPIVRVHVVRRDAGGVGVQFAEG